MQHSGDTQGHSDMKQKNSASFITYLSSTEEQWLHSVGVLQRLHLKVSAIKESKQSFSDNCVLQ